MDLKRHADHIDLHDIDARLGGENDAFRWIGAQAFHGRAGELHVVKKADFVFVEADVNGDRRADLQIQVDHFSGLSKGDFIL